MLNELEKEQQLAFNRLKKAYKDCAKLRVELINQYGHLYAYNGKHVTGLGDETIPPSGHPILYDNFRAKFYNPNIIPNIDSGRADDEGLWVIGLTDKGLKLYDEESSD